MLFRSDAGYEAANITTATAATNAAGSITDIDRTAGSTTVQLTGTGFVAAYPVGTKVQIFAGTAAGEAPVNVPAALIGSWTVTAVASGNITISGTGFTVADTTGINATDTLAGLAGTIRVQSLTAGQNNVVPGAAVTVTPWAAAS